MRGRAYEIRTMQSTERTSYYSQYVFFANSYATYVPLHSYVYAQLQNTLFAGTTPPVINYVSIWIVLCIPYGYDYFSCYCFGSVFFFLRTLKTKTRTLRVQSAVSRSQSGNRLTVTLNKNRRRRRLVAANRIVLMKVNRRATVRGIKKSNNIYLVTSLIIK